MGALRILFAAMFVLIVVYTGVTIQAHGWNLFPDFLGDISAMNWPGQFNTDFLCFLVLSGLWVAWRHHFSALGLVLAPIATVGGILFLSVYLFIMSFRVDDDVVTLLIGPERARAR